MRRTSRVLLSSHLLLPALLSLAGLVLPAALAAQNDVIRGQVTGVEGAPLAGVRVTATSLPGNVTRSAQTNERGSFQIVFPGGPGDYIMGYAVFGYAFKQQELKRLADEAVLVADARLSPIQLDSMVVVAPARERVDRNQRPEDISGTERAIAADQLPPGQQGDIAAMAASLPGVALVPGLDGQADGFSVLGMGADQNSVTLNGLQTGANGLPRDAAVTSSLTTSPYDPSRGGFSGGNFNITSRSGSNLRTRGMSLQATSPQVQWIDPTARALGNAYSSFSLGGIVAGPIRRNASFYSLSYQLGRDSRDNATLLNRGGGALQTAGVAQDSVARLLSILRAQGVPLSGGRNPASRLSDNGSVFGSIDFTPPASSSGQSLGLTFNGRWQRMTGIGGGVTSLPTTAGDHTSWNGGLQARHSGYLGMVLSETSAGVNASHDADATYVDLPAGRVLVRSSFDDGTSGLQNLGFGGSPGLGSSSRSMGASLRNALSWFDNANKHRLQLTTELQLNGNAQRQASNRAGTFSFNSLEDLAAGRPASFTRLPSPRERSTGLVSAALSLGDAWRRTPDFQLQYGLRLDAGRYTTRPEYNPLVESTFGVRNDRAPAPVSISPRVGFSWTVGRAQEVSSFAGAARTPRAIIRGGIGVFSNAMAASQIGTAMDNTGLPDASRQITCVGDAVPVPDWPGYAAGSAAIPDRCADGSTGTVFSSLAPNVTLFSRSFATPKTVRSNLSWGGNVLGGRISANVEGTYQVGLDLQRAYDLNFRDTPRFTLADDGRPVYVDPASIVPATGAVASQDARISPAFARVTELRSDLRSRTAQLSLRLGPVPRGPTRFGWSLAYTYSRIRDQAAGFSTTAGSPLAVDWAQSAQGPHQVNYSLRYNFFDAVSVSWNGSLRSGNAFTPVVAGDVNGDGYWNDRAFVYSPATTTDPALAEGMRALLAQAPASTRACLERQLGRIAGRNSCRGPWTSGYSSLGITLDRAKFRMPQRGTVSFSLSNPIVAADLLMHGQNGLRGWGQSAYPDPTLLYVRGFDPAARRYQYEVNPRFGATRPQMLTSRLPVVLTASVRLDVGPTREHQMLADQIAAQRSPRAQASPESMIRTSMLAGSIPNPLSAVLRTQDSLQLTAPQADSIAAMNRRYTYRADSLWAPLQRYLSALPKNVDQGEVNTRYLKARGVQVDMLSRLGPAVRALLTPEQRRKLPSFIASVLDPRYLALIRGGSYTYLGGSPLTGGGMDMGFFDMVSVMSSGAGQTMVIIRTAQ